MKVASILPLLFTAAVAFGQVVPPTTPCDSNTNLTVDGNICTNILIGEGQTEQNGYENFNLAIVQEDNLAEISQGQWPGLSMTFIPTFFSTNIAEGGMGLPEDPIKILSNLSGVTCGGVPCSAYGYTETDVDGGVTSTNPVNGPVDPTCIGYRGAKNYQWQDVTYTVTNFNVGGTYGPGNPYPPYPYDWNGTFTLRFYGVPHRNRYGCSNRFVTDGKTSWITLIATHQ